MTTTKIINPPKLALRLFRWYCRSERQEELEGDLEEMHELRKLRMKSAMKIKLLFWWDVVRCLKSYSVKKTQPRNFRIMLIKNHFKTGYRNIVRNKSFTLLNVVGLALGMSASLLILQYVKYERSYDTFHLKSSDIYRIQYNQYQSGSIALECAAAVPAVGPSLKNNFSEVVEFTRLYPVFGGISYDSPKRGLITFREEKMHIADPAIFKIFDFKLTKGNVATCLEGPNKVVVSKSSALKYFGNEDPIGKIITWTSNTWTFSGEREFEVTGVMDDVPNNSHLKFNFLFSYQTINDQSENDSETSWQWYDFYTYIFLRPGTDREVFQKKWDEYVVELRGEKWESNGTKQGFILQPLLDIHLYSDLLQESIPEEKGDGDAVYFLTIIGLFILLIAWINYINIATAKAAERAKEVGIRKVLGAAKSQLRNQFIVEATLLNCMAIILALVLVVISWPWLAVLSGQPLPFALITEPSFWILALGLLLAGIMISGFYPALVLAAINPLTILKGWKTSSNGGVSLRKGLVVFQFFSSVVLISGTLIVASQLSFIRNQDLGVDINETLVLEGPRVVIDSMYWQSLGTFKTEVMRISGISGMTASSNVPGKEIFMTSNVRRLSGGPETSTTYNNVAIDYDYVPSFDLKLIAGRNFREDSPSDMQGTLVNRSLAKSLEFLNPQQAVGERIVSGKDTFQIVGVIEDYHQMSLRSTTGPIMMYLEPNNINFYSFKMKSDNYREVLAGIEVIWNKFFPENPYDYFFLDEFFNQQYTSDRKFGTVFGLFSVLAIFVACLGLFGLASFMNMQRRKEVGIRKTLGCNVSSILILLTGGFVKLVLLGALAATPLSWYIMSLWLENFSYRIAISPLVFVISTCIVLLIALFSVGYQTVKTALVNPAETLRYND